MGPRWPLSLVSRFSFSGRTAGKGLGSEGEGVLLHERRACAKSRLFVILSGTLLFTKLFSLNLP